MSKPEDLLLDVPSNSKCLMSPCKKTLEELDAVHLHFADDTCLMVRYEDYLHSRREGSELHQMVYDDLTADKAASVSIRALSVMESSIRKALKMSKDLRAFLVPKKKKLSRYPIDLLDKIIQELDDVCPCEDFETFLSHLLDDSTEETTTN